MQYNIFIFLHGIRGLGLGFPPISHSSRHRLPCRRPREAPSSLSGVAPNPIPVPPPFLPSRSPRRKGAPGARARRPWPQRRRDSFGPGTAARPPTRPSEAQSPARTWPAKRNHGSSTGAWIRPGTTRRVARRPSHGGAQPRGGRGPNMRGDGHGAGAACISGQARPPPSGTNWPRRAHTSPASGGGSRARLHPPPSWPPRRPPPSSSPRRPWRSSSQLLPHLPLVLGLHQVVAFTTSSSWPLSPMPSSPSFLYSSRCSSSLCFLSGRLAPCSADTSPRTHSALPLAPMAAAVSSWLPTAATSPWSPAKLGSMTLGN